MKSDPNDFEALRKLIALKRYEQPPPGYFNRLPDRIAARLERGDGRAGFWANFLGQFTFRPAFVYGFSLAALSALTVSVAYSVKSQSEQTARGPRDVWRAALPADALASQYDSSQPLHVVNWTTNENDSNPALTMPSLFGPDPRMQPRPVSFAGPP